MDLMDYMFVYVQTKPFGKYMESNLMISHMFIFPQCRFSRLNHQVARWLCLFAFVCLCGIIWFWLPLAALLASLVLPLLFSGKLLFLLLRVAGCHEYEAPYPWNIKQFVELEVYMRHLPACGNAPRAMLFVIMHVWDSPPSDEGGQFVFCMFLHEMNNIFHFTFKNITFYCACISSNEDFF